MTDADRIAQALEVAFRYGQIDGDHHKAWVIDQMVRALTSDVYEDWITAYQGDYDAEEELYEYEWDEGIAP